MLLHLSNLWRMMMSTQSIARNDAERGITETIRTYWVVFLVQGIIIIVLGAAAIVWPQISTIAVDLFVGWMFLLSGLTGLVTMFLASSLGGFLWSLLTAALSLFVGMLLIWHPVEGAVTLTLVLIAFFITEGIFQIVGAIQHRAAFPNSWGWLLMSGIADLVLAGMLISGWPSTAVWALGLIVGLNLITSGLAIVMMASAARSIVRMAQ
jgi:uncharacterized membrane protein HdeD (DUF308 family)